MMKLLTSETYTAPLYAPGVIFGDLQDELHPVRVDNLGFQHGNSLVRPFVPRECSSRIAEMGHGLEAHSDLVAPFAKVRGLDGHLHLSEAVNR